MALHFDHDEFESRKARTTGAMREAGLDAMLLFAPESMYWLTGYDTFGFCFFQCMVLKTDGTVALLTRSADLRQARHTSNVETIVIWQDRAGANPTQDLRSLLDELDLLGMKLGIEYDTQGLTGRWAKALDETLSTFADTRDASTLIPTLRAVKSPAEIDCVRKAGELCDAALEAALPLIRGGADEGAILAAMQGEMFALGGDYAGNEFIIGSSDDALLCRYKSGRRALDDNDQLTLEWAGAWRRYHVARMDTVIIGKPRARHEEMHAAACAALQGCEAAMQVGNTFGDVFDAHAEALAAVDMTRHRLNACGYSLGAHYTPCWMDMPMFYAGNPEPIRAGMVLFAHMIICDSDTKTAMTLGRTYLTGDEGPQPLSNAGMEMIIRP